MERTKRGFKLIPKDEYVDLSLKANPSDCRRDVIARLDDAIGAYRDGRRCSCGEEIWIVGSAESGYGCFSCITGDSAPDNDYEIEVSPTT